MAFSHVLGLTFGLALCLQAETISRGHCEPRSCKAGPPAEEDVIKVKWPWWETVEKHLGSVAVCTDQAESKDGSQIAIKREDMCTLDEELTKAVEAATASDMQFEDTFYGADENLRGEKEEECSGSK